MQVIMSLADVCKDMPVLFLLILLASTSRACAETPVKTVTIEIGSERLLEGESQQIKCHTSGVIEEDVIQIYKMTIHARSPVSRFEGSFTINYVISANDTLNSEMYEQTEGRYVLSMYHTSKKNVTVQLDISDVKSRDSASYLCGIGSMFNQWKDRIEASEEKYFMVEGPIKHVKMNSPRRGTTECSAPLQETGKQEITVYAGSEATMDCEVGLDMNPRMPGVEVFVNSRPVPCLEVEKRSYYVPMHQVPLYDECVTLFYIWKFTPVKSDDGAKIVCQANLPQIFPKYINTTRTMRVIDPPISSKPNQQSNAQTGESLGGFEITRSSLETIILATFLSVVLHVPVNI